MTTIRATLLLFAVCFPLLGTGCVALAVRAAKAGYDNMSRPECAGYDAARSLGSALSAEARRLQAAGRIQGAAMVEAEQEGAIHELRLRSLCSALRDNTITRQQYQDGFDRAAAALQRARDGLGSGGIAQRAASSG